MREISPFDLNTLILCAFRYALGRKTYIVKDISDLILKYQDNLQPHIIDRIRKEIVQAIETNNYGMEMDREEWMKLNKELNMKKLCNKKIKRTEYSLIEGDDKKYHVRKSVGYNVTYLYTSRIKDEAIKFYEQKVNDNTSA